MIYVYRNKQKNVEDYFQKKKTTPCTPQEAAVLPESILTMMVKVMRPLAMVEGEGFKEMLNTFQSGVVNTTSVLLRTSSGQSHL